MSEKTNPTLDEPPPARAKRTVEDIERELKAESGALKPIRPIEPHNPDQPLKGSKNAPAHDNRVTEPLELEPRSFASKLLGVGIFGWLRLFAICILVGVVLQASGINPFDQEFTWQGGLSALGQGALSVLSWSVTNGWRPALAGAIVILPVWLLYRLVTTPFRR